MFFFYYSKTCFVTIRVADYDSIFVVVSIIWASRLKRAYFRFSTGRLRNAVNVAWIFLLHCSFREKPLRLICIVDLNQFTNLGILPFEYERHIDPSFCRLLFRSCYGPDRECYSSLSQVRNIFGQYFFMVYTSQFG